MDSIHKPKSTLKPKFDFSDLVLILEPFILEPKSSISQNHILLLDQGIGHNNYEMIFQDWSYKGKHFHDRILHDPIHMGIVKM